MKLGLPTAADDSEAGNEHAKANRWLLFDGDNTLWHIEAMYDRARQLLTHCVAESGVDPNEIEAFQRWEDRRLFQEVGYSATRFATSFENTLRKFVPAAATAQVQYVRRLALSVLESPAEIDPDAAEVLGFLERSHNLALITAGEQWVQERRLTEFRYTDMFDVVRIVERKTPEVFRELVADLGIAAQSSWVIGDSLRSDIIPALSAGLNAILIANHNWIEVEQDENWPVHLRVVDRLGAILPIIVEADPEIPAPT